ncbi:hypothetical protein PAXRUDRAFT_19181 [Paxillus rubicundulus Ve08.2h10]|uniref:Alpha-type protein kinase domain-containing protein n=1 Tax=Paxillus rubicundulus Ve08.2h10 TaxID=930991 RepID=A0A0D0DCY6_9AGAM|nr:hypothetical protein PAXRUDRAFT_19181 [Paxillus rubicundulus Ve08.2h10]
MTHFSLFASTRTPALMESYLSIALTVACLVTNLGRLTPSPLAVSGLGQTRHQPVAVKQPYYRVKDRTSGYANITRYTPALETSKIHKDANVHYWAHALLSSTYPFIDCALSMSSEPPPFEIPHVRFVDAAVAITHSEGTTVQVRSGKTKYSTVRSCYLVEELIKVDAEEEFIKYIHNSDAKPLPDPDDPHFPLAEFFVFTQHVQYKITGGLAIISDFQGSGDLLTDPQILTHP